MSWNTLLLLSAGRPADDRDRRVLLACAVALAGALLIAAGRLLQVHGYVEVTSGYSTYISEPGLRQGVGAGALLLTVPLFALAYQAVRVGSAARRRRSQQLVLAGATPQQAQAISAFQAVRAAALGAVWAGPVYLVLAAVFGAVSPAAQLLPAPSPFDVVSWALFIVVASLGTAASDLLAGRPRTSAPHRGRAWLAGASVALLILVVSSPSLSRSTRGQGLVALSAVVLALIAALSGGPWLVLAAVWWQQRRSSAVNLLAVGRTLADLRGPGRVASVLLVAGLAVGYEAGLSVSQSGDGGFYRTGDLMVGVAVGLAVLVGLLTLVVAAAEQLLDGARPLASMSALGVDAVTLRRVQQRQLSAATVPASALGLLVGSLAARYLQASGLTPLLWSLTVAACGAATIEVLCVAATLALTRRRAAATDIEHLRAT